MLSAAVARCPLSAVTAPARHASYLDRMRSTAVLLVLLAVVCLVAWKPVEVSKDALVFMPGSQQGSATINNVAGCVACHGGYNPAAEPAHTWRGSMMAQASRDPLWLAAMTAAEQDSIWLTGTPNAGDLCIRCHVPIGWLGGRNDPANMTNLEVNDMEGVNCDFCHRLADPVAQLRQPSVAGEVPGSAAAREAERTLTADVALLSSLKLFDGTPFLDASTKLPRFYASRVADGYAEASSGQYFVDANGSRRGPRADAMPMHAVSYSRFHRSATLCATCHDVSNAALANNNAPGSSSSRTAASYFHLERTWSEFVSSGYAREGGRCQDCHMRRATERAARMPGVPVRNDLAVHDLSGGNAWILGILASVDRSGPAFDDYNDAILSGRRHPGASIETGGLQGQAAALLDGRVRALAQLHSAAAIELAGHDASTLRLRVRNRSGHKLISGFPEGRRMWLNVRFLDAAGRVVQEVNPYEPLIVRKNASGSEEYVSGGDLQRTHDDLVYEAKMSSTHTGETNTFHFVLATDRTKDNRIPPRGFDVATAAERLALPRAAGRDAPELFTAAEYAGGYDEVALPIPPGSVTWKATLYYQTTAKAYIEFLRDEIKGTARTLAAPSPSGESAAYIVQSDPFFGTLRGWGDAIWDLWLHNGGSAPIEMTTLSSAPARRRAVRR